MFGLLVVILFLSVLTLLLLITATFSEEDEPVSKPATAQEKNEINQSKITRTSQINEVEKRKYINMLIVGSIFVCACISLFWFDFIYPENQRNWISNSSKICDEELKSIEDNSFTITDGFLDEHASLYEKDILDFFSEKRLKFVEIKIKNENDNTKRIMLAEFYYNQLNPLLNNSTKPYVRLELGKIGEENCINFEDKSYIKRNINSPPFLPNKFHHIKNLPNF